MVKKLAPFILIIALLIAFFSLWENTEKLSYVDEVRLYRQEAASFLKNDSDTPLTPAQQKDFDGLNYYPIDSTFRLEAKFEELEQKEFLNLPTSDGSSSRYLKYGRAKFDMHGSTHSLLILKNPADSELFLAFADETSGRETYGGGRYLDLESPKFGKIVLDFNFSYNPYCAYNPDYICPLPPAENVLEIAIEAGEKKFHDD